MSHRPIRRNCSNGNDRVVYMRRIYVARRGNRRYVPIGWMCLLCRKVILDGG